MVPIQHMEHLPANQQQTLQHQCTDFQADFARLLTQYGIREYVLGVNLPLPTGEDAEPQAQIQVVEAHGERLSSFLDLTAEVGQTMLQGTDHLANEADRVGAMLALLKSRFGIDVEAEPIEPSGWGGQIGQR